MSEASVKQINDDIIKFIACKLADSIELESQFAQIKKQKWNDSMVLIAELNVQLGQLSMILNATDGVLEPERQFNDIGDELSDILLNLLYLSHLENVEVDDVTKYKDFNIYDLKILTAILGKLAEVILEKNGYRFEKKHGNYENTQNYIKDLISLMYFIIFNYASIHSINLNEEFDKMLSDAKNFVNKKKLILKKDIKNGNN